MASQNEIQFALSLKNEASATLQQFQTDAKSAMEAAGKATEDYGKKTTQLSQWIKEERAEQRQHNFIFNQTREVMSGASMVLALYGNTLGQTSETQKMLTNSLNAGFVAFQGVNNVVGLLGKSVTALAGPWGIAISLAAAGAVAMSQFSQSVSDTKGNVAAFDERIKQAQISLGTYTKAMQINDFENKIAAAEAKLFSLGKTVIDFDATVKARLESGGKVQYVYKTIGTPEEIREQQAIIEESVAGIKKLSDELTKNASAPTVISKMNNDLDESQNKFAALFRGQNEYEIQSTSSLKNNLAIQNAWSQRFAEIDLQNKKKNNERQLAAAKRSVEMQTEIYGNFTSAIGQTYQSVLGDQFEKAIGNQNSILEIFLAQAGRNLIAWSAEQIANVVLNAIIGRTTAAATVATLSAEMAALTAVSGPAALAVNVASFGAAGAAAGLSFTTAAASQLTAMTAVSLPLFHEGGTMDVTGMRRSLASDERPAILRVGETVRTRDQEAALASRRPTIGTLNINVAGDGVSPAAVKRAVEEGLRQTNLTVEQYFVNPNVGMRQKKLIIGDLAYFRYGNLGFIYE